jgi:putative hydrolase of the HAD superfamily
VPEEATSPGPQTPQTPPSKPSTRIKGVITDWGGVLTNPLPDTVNAWIDAEQIDRDSYVAVMRSWISSAYRDGEGENPVHALERGEAPDQEFERALAEQLRHLDGRPVVPDGLLARMFGATALDEVMLELIRSLKRSGLKTALLSNSWGNGGYPRHLFPDLFDVVVISSEVGMRKPEERIFRHTAELLGLEPGECVFLDDIEANIAAAQALGIVCLRHEEAARSVAWLRDLLGLPPADDPA